MASPLSLVQEYTAIRWPVDQAFSFNQVENFRLNRGTTLEDLVDQVGNQLSSHFQLCGCRVEPPVWVDFERERAFFTKEDSVNPQQLTILLVVTGSGELNLPNCERTVELQPGTLVAYRADSEPTGIVTPASPISLIRTAIRLRKL